jgi:hypothetical protein
MSSLESRTTRKRPCPVCYQKVSCSISDSISNPGQELEKEGSFIMVQLLLAFVTVNLMVSLVVYQAYKLKRLRSHGKQVVALVISIRHETGKTASGFARDNSYVTATWTDPRTGQTYTFWTWIMNSRLLFTRGSLVPVLIDPKNPKRYTLDL